MISLKDWKETFDRLGTFPQRQDSTLDQECFNNSNQRSIS